jgi:SAM-dependent methyltransferase
VPLEKDDYERAVPTEAYEKWAGGRQEGLGSTVGAEQNIMKLKASNLIILRRVLPIARYAYRTYMRILCWYVNLQDRRYIKKAGFVRLPPASLRYRVHGFLTIGRFLRGGKRRSETIEAVLEKIGKDFDSFQDVLDFGCGCGRTLTWFADRSPRLHGPDIDAEAIS